jgi:NOL1/NOP2/fmu family ribosome biogenesis protein
MMRKEEAAREGWTLENIKVCHDRDIEILNCANKMLKKGGKLIYSTCTFAKEEDCEIVSYIESLGYHTIPASKEIVSATYEGFLPNTYRFYPMKRGEGQFAALLEKDSDEDSCNLKTLKTKEDKDINIVKKFLNENLNIQIKNIIKYGNRYYIPALPYDLSKLNIKNYGIELGEIVNNRFVPFHDLFKALGNYFKNQVELDYNDPLIMHYLKGEEIIHEALNGWGVIKVSGLVLGGFKATNNHLKNHYPKGLRNMKLEE